MKLDIITFLINVLKSFKNIYYLILNKEETFETILNYIF